MHECNAPALFSVAPVLSSLTGLVYRQPADSAGLVRGMMDEFIGRLVADSGADRTATHSAFGIVAQFPLEYAPFVRTIVRESLKFSRELEQNAVGVIVGAIPRLGQFV
jgi:hypothetical protein